MRILSALLCILLTAIPAFAQTSTGFGGGGGTTNASNLTTGTVAIARGGTGAQSVIALQKTLALVGARKLVAGYSVEPSTTIRSAGQGPSVTGAVSGDAQADYGAAVLYTSAASADAAAGFTGWGSMNWRRSYAPIYIARFKLGSDISACRIKAGICSNVAGQWTTDSIGITMTVEYCTVRDGTAFWRCRTTDQTTTDLAVTTMPIAADDYVEVWIDTFSSSSQVDYYIGRNGAIPTLVHSATTGLPDNTQSMLAVCGVSTTEAVAKSISISSVAINSY